MMRKVIAFSSLIGMMALGCQSPVATSVPLLNGNTGLPTISVGREYAITTKTSADKRLTYLGKVKEIEGDDILLESPMLIARQEQTLPILGHIPVLKNQFKNVEVEQDKSEVDVTVNRSDILDATPIEESTNRTEQSDELEASMQSVLQPESISRSP